MIAFTKMHGLGNDFIVLYGLDIHEHNIPRLAKAMCDRHAGIGADGLVIVEDSEQCDLRMRIINADGSEAEMCGNGIRCFARFAYDEGLVHADSFTVETLAGVMTPQLNTDGFGEVIGVTVNMGTPRLGRADIPVAGNVNTFWSQLEIEGHKLDISILRVGVPHTMVWVEDAVHTPVQSLGPLVENHPMFPERTNVDFVQVLDDKTLIMRTWERGAGATKACGTGACASVVAAQRLGYVKRCAEVRLELGSLFIEYTRDGNILMSGPAEYICSGVWMRD